MLGCGVCLRLPTVVVDGVLRMHHEGDEVRRVSWG